MKKTINNGSLDFSLDYDLECEDFNLYNGDEEIDDVSYDDVTNYVNKLIKEVNEFEVSEHRTEGVIEFKGDKMEIRLSVFDLPEDGEFHDVVIENIPIIPFEYEVDEE